MDIEIYNITEDIHATSLHQYQCKVSIEHNSDVEETYNGLMIILNKIGKIVPCS